MNCWVFDPKKGSTFISDFFVGMNQIMNEKWLQWPFLDPFTNRLFFFSFHRPPGPWKKTWRSILVSETGQNVWREYMAFLPFFFCVWPSNPLRSASKRDFLLSFRVFGNPRSPAVHPDVQETFSVRESQATSTISALSLELARPSIHRQVVNQRTMQPSAAATTHEHGGSAATHGGSHRERGSGRRSETVRQSWITFC